MHLFEFGEYQPLPANIALHEFKAYIKQVWDNRKLFYAEYEQETYTNDHDLAQTSRQGQALINFDGREIQARNYAGFLQYKHQCINILPKIFKGKSFSTMISFEHLLYYLSYGRSFRFPFDTKNSYDFRSQNMLQLLIHWFALAAQKSLEENPFQTYQEISQSSAFMQGKLDVHNYIRHNIGNGRWHEVFTRHTPFVYDNTFNQLLKHTINEIHPFASTSTLSILQSLQFILQEVSEQSFTCWDCDSLDVSNLDHIQHHLVEWCRFFLANKQLTASREHGNYFSFLLPMERVFEEFIAGFIVQHFPQLQAQVQSAGNLAVMQEKKAFAIKNDIWLPVSSTIIDTKYKVLTCGSADVIENILQQDLYQMVAYAIRRGSTSVHLLYPDTGHTEDITLQVTDALAGKVIHIHIHFLPVMVPDEKLLKNNRVDDILTPLLKKKLSAILIGR